MSQTPSKLDRVLQGRFRPAEYSPMLLKLTGILLLVRVAALVVPQRFITVVIFTTLYITILVLAYGRWQYTFLQLLFAIVTSWMALTILKILIFLGGG